VVLRLLRHRALNYFLLHMQNVSTIINPLILWKTSGQSALFGQHSAV
jgi:hypothetical protein